MILASPERIREYTKKGWWGSKTLVDCFQQHVRENPGQVALVDPPDREDLLGSLPETVTYQGLNRVVDAVATAFLEMGIGKDDVVIVQLPNCWELAMLYMAVTRAGALISPLPVQWREREFAYTSKLTDAVAFITVDEFKAFQHRQMAERVQPDLPRLKHIITLERIREMAGGPVDEASLNKVKIDANDIFTLCWTSGTEAEPKGCPLSHNNWLNQGRLQIETVGIRPGDIQLTAGPLVNMASVGTTFIPWLIVGGTYILHHPFNPQLFIKQIVTERVNYTLLVPAVGFLRQIICIGGGGEDRQ